MDVNNTKIFDIHVVETEIPYRKELCTSPCTIQTPECLMLHGDTLEVH